VAREYHLKYIILTTNKFKILGSKDLTTTTTTIIITTTTTTTTKFNYSHLALRFQCTIMCRF
jgi:hypothetical protein